MISNPRMHYLRESISRSIMEEWPYNYKISVVSVTRTTIPSSTLLKTMILPLVPISMEPSRWLAAIRSIMVVFSFRTEVYASLLRRLCTIYPRIIPEVLLCSRKSADLNYLSWCTSHFAKCVLLWCQLWGFWYWNIFGGPIRWYLHLVNIPLEFDDTTIPDHQLGIPWW